MKLTEAPLPLLFVTVGFQVYIFPSYVNYLMKPHGSQRILHLITLLFRFAPEGIAQGNLVTIIARLTGGGLGLASLYYTSIFDTLLSLSLLFITEYAHSALSSQRTELHTAQVIARLPSIPSVSTLLRINVMFISVLMGLYMDNTHYIKRSITTIAASEMVRRWFIKLSRDMALPAEDYHYFEYCFVQLGLQFGELIFSGYDNVRMKMIDREKIMRVLNDSAIESGIINVDANFRGIIIESIA